MAFTDLSLLDMLKTKMNWHQARQKVLAGNVANADTPGYRSNDLKAPDFSSMVSAQRIVPLAVRRTSAAHIQGAVLSDGSVRFGAVKGVDWEVTPEGNAVVLEEQMMKVTQNQFDYQVATTLYSRSIGLLKMALGR